MITFPCAKINLGLNVIAAREDGYHDIETVFYPIPITDALEIKYMDEHFPSEYNCDLKITGNAVDCDEQHNLVVKAYDLLAASPVISGKAPSMKCVLDSSKASSCCVEIWAMCSLVP